MRSRIAKPFSAARRWLAAHWRAALLIAVVAACLAGGAVYLLTEDDDGRSEPQASPTPAPAPRVVVREREVPTRPDDLGFPAFATKNTTRVAGPDPIADAAAVALAVFPSTGAVPGPDAVTLVDADDWQGGIAAASLVAAPVSAPILITAGSEVPALTEGAARALAPQGSKRTGGEAAFAVGGAAVPDGLEALELEGAGPAAVAAEIAAQRRRLAGRPDHLLLVGSRDPAVAMPAASWAARSGDPVLYVDRARVPGPTRDLLARYDGRVPVYVLGAEDQVGERAFAEVRKLAPNATRIEGAGPVEVAIAFARYSGGSFGWNINDPGHGLVLASAERPLDAAAAAALSASGTWGPLLVSDDAATLPESLRGYLLDLKPGYLDDPTRAVYNHVWVIGDTSALSVDLQAELDELAEVTRVTSGTGPASAPQPTTESEPDQPRSGNRGSNGDR